MTVNKSQGQTMKRVGLALHRQQCFGHGQIYVAFSRVTRQTGIKVFSSIAHHVQNYVYQPILEEQDRIKSTTTKTAPYYPIFAQQNANFIQQQVQVVSPPPPAPFWPMFAKQNDAFLRMKIQDDTPNNPNVAGFDVMDYIDDENTDPEDEPLILSATSKRKSQTANKNAIDKKKNKLSDVTNTTNNTNNDNDDNRSDDGFIGFGAPPQFHQLPFRPILRPGSKRKDVDGDGNCLFRFLLITILTYLHINVFRAIVYSIEGSQINHAMIRTVISRCILENPDKFTWLINYIPTGVTIEEYAQHLLILARDCMDRECWGGELEVLLASIVLDRPIINVYPLFSQRKVIATLNLPTERV